MCVLFFLCCLLLFVSVMVSVGIVYKWKDVNGVIQYLEKLLVGKIFEMCQVQYCDLVGLCVQVVVFVVELIDCIIVCSNLVLFNGQGVVMQDIDGDGKVEIVLNDEQCGVQKMLVEVVIKVYCKFVG